MLRVPRRALRVALRVPRTFSNISHSAGAPRRRRGAPRNLLRGLSWCRRGRGACGQRRGAFGQRVRELGAGRVWAERPVRGPRHRARGRRWPRHGVATAAGRGGVLAVGAKWMRARRLAVATWRTAVAEPVWSCRARLARVEIVRRRWRRCAGLARGVGRRVCAGARRPRDIVGGWLRVAREWAAANRE